MPHELSSISRIVWPYELGFLSAWSNDILVCSVVAINVNHGSSKDGQKSLYRDHIMAT